MKQNYIFCLIGILSICNAIFSAEPPAVPQAIQDFNTAYDAALQLEKDGNENEALVKYGKAAEIIIPKSTGVFVDEYSNERKKQAIAREKLENKAAPLRDTYKLGEALKIYKLAPNAFSDEINFLEHAIEIRLEQIQTDIFDNVHNLISQGKYSEATVLLEKVIEDPMEYDVVIEEVEKLLDTITKASEKALISALHNLKNGFVQIGNKMAST